MRHGARWRAFSTLSRHVNSISQHTTPHIDGPRTASACPRLPLQTARNGKCSKQASKRAGRHDVRNRHDLSIQGPTRSISDADTGCGTQHNTCVMVHMCLFVANSSSLAATEARVRYLLCRALSVHRGRFSAYDGPPEPEPKMEMYLFSCHLFSCHVLSRHLFSRRLFSCQLSS